MNNFNLSSACESVSTIRTAAPLPTEPVPLTAPTDARAMSTTTMQSMPLHSRRTRLENAIRTIAGSVGNRTAAREQQPKNTPAQREPMHSAEDLLQRFDEVFTYEHLSADLARYLRRDAEALRCWLQDVSQSVPLIARANLATWAIPHLLHIVETESRHRASEHGRIGSSATTVTESFMEGAENYALLSEERALAALLEERIPLEDRNEHKLTQSRAEKARIVERITVPERHIRPPLPPVIKDWMDRHDVQRQRHCLAVQLRQTEGKFQFLRNEISQKIAHTEQRKSEVEAFKKALERTFSQTRREATDQLSELPAMRQIMRQPASFLNSQRYTKTP